MEHFIKKLINSENPLNEWNYATCPTNKDFHLIGLNDDGLGNKKLEILLRIDFENKLLHFAMIEEVDKTKPKFD